jgi:hypothetical protein
MREIDYGKFHLTQHPCDLVDHYTGEKFSILQISEFDSNSDDAKPTGRRNSVYVIGVNYIDDFICNHTFCKRLMELPRNARIKIACVPARYEVVEIMRCVK